ncbi:hypothetical protein HY642_03245 [Candidatus Woesearchaeota archaeon]|nr:hypothetical protein [Candidatus Woesearchaeota archaeon]
MDDTTLLRIALIIALVSVPVLLAISAQPRKLSALSTCDEQGTLEGTVVDFARKGRTQTVTMLIPQRVIMPSDITIKEGAVIRVTGTVEEWNKNRVIMASSVTT